MAKKKAKTSIASSTNKSAKAIKPKQARAIAAPSASLGHATIKKIQGLLTAKKIEEVRRGLSLLASLNATISDYELVFTSAVMRAALAVINDLQLTAETDLGLALLEHDDNTARACEHTLGDILQMHIAFSYAVRRRFLETYRAASVRHGSFVDLVEIPSGTFTMGSPRRELGRHKDENQVTARLTRPFHLSRTVVTQKQWFAVMGTKPWMLEGGTVLEEYGEPVEVTFSPTDGRLRSGHNHPAVFVTWQHAMLFCKMLTDCERAVGRLSVDSAYRLPTEAEWEYACRAGTTSAYSFGDDATRLGEYGWCDVHSDGHLHAVAQLRPNPWGLFDMHGNVSEWCSDWYAPDRAGGYDPTGPAIGSQRVARGGSGESDASSCRSAARLAWRPWERDWRLLSIGFRVVLAPIAKQATRRRKSSR